MHGAPGWHTYLQHPNSHRERALDDKPDYVSDPEPQVSPAQADAQLVVNRIKQALVTARLTLGNQNTGADPYNCRADRRRASMWGNRRR